MTLGVLLFVCAAYQLYGLDETLRLRTLGKSVKIVALFIWGFVIVVTVLAAVKLV